MSNVQSLHSTANLLQFLSVRNACSNFLNKNMNAKTCVGIYLYTKTHACMKMAEKAKSYSLRHLSTVF